MLDHCLEAEDKSDPSVSRLPLAAVAGWVLHLISMKGARAGTEGPGGETARTSVDRAMQDSQFQTAGSVQRSPSQSIYT